MMNQVRENERDADHRMPSWREVFLYFLFLGFVNVGGPVAQITMMFNHMHKSWQSQFGRTRAAANCGVCLVNDNGTSRARERDRRRETIRSRAHYDGVALSVATPGPFMLKRVEPIMRSNWLGVGLILKRAEV